MWDPSVYLAFDDHRGRPFYELLARVGAREPRRVVDLGCGPGNLTGSLSQRWPDAVVTGVDSSPEMVRAAKERGVDARVGDVREWTPESDTDVVVCNATLQWVPGHGELLRDWVAALPSGAWFAFQVPGNFDAPSHRAIRELAAEQPWCERLSGLTLRGSDAVSEPAEYAESLLELGCEVDVWETTYQQRLTGEDPVLDWVRGTALRPIADTLAERDFAEFSAQLRERLRAAYPPLSDGSTLFEFRRIFAVARVP